MKNRTIDTAFIVKKWDVEKRSFREISEMDIPCCAQLKTIRNIVYSCGKGDDLFRKKVYRLYRIKFLELQDVPAAIAWVYENQPTVRVTRITVYRVIKDYIKSLKK
jgi:hypothetical protein